MMRSLAKAGKRFEGVVSRFPIERGSLGAD
jgi:hypothetical protein